MNRQSERAALGFALAAMLLWSTVATAFKLALRTLEPIDLLCLSIMVSWTALAAALLRQRLSARRSAGASGVRSTGGSEKEAVIAGVLGILNPLVYYWILFTAYDRLPAQIAQPLTYTWPLFLALLALPINGRGPAGSETAGIIISLAGVVLTARSGGGENVPADLPGVLLALGSAVIWALYWLVGNRLTMDGTLRLFTGFSTALPAAVVIWGIRGFNLPGNVLEGLAVLWTGLFEMGITFIFWNTALSLTARPARIGNLVYIGPFISLIWIALVLKEPIHPFTIVGLAVIVLGILAGRNVLRLPRPSRGR